VSRVPAVGRSDESLFDRLATETTHLLLREWLNLHSEAVVHKGERCRTDIQGHVVRNGRSLV
jgi:hypothetical protein